MSFRYDTRRSFIGNRLLTKSRCPETRPALPSPPFLVKLYTFDQEQWLPQPREAIFPFFAEASNLEAITPPWVGFKILTPTPIEMKAGTIIDYRIHIHGIPIRWRTEITAWQPLSLFVDEQRIGPYRKWKHTHTFESVNGGTLCRDHVEYAVPGGALIHRLFVRSDVEKIFAHRHGVLEKLFGKP